MDLDISALFLLRGRTETMNVLDLKPGTILRYEGVMYTVLSAQHTHQQQRRGLVRCKARALQTGKLMELVFRSDVDVEEIRLDEVPLQFLYRDGENYVFMDEATYEQFTLTSEQVAEHRWYLKENLSVAGLFHEGKIVDIRLPVTVDLTVTEAEPGFKGDTVTGGRKRATLETGLVVQVPLFVEAGNVIRVDTRTGEYVTRVE